MSDPLVARLDEAVAGGRGVLFLSAHLDDAVLSCGGLLSRLAGRTPVTVVTVFTEAGPPPHTRAARAFLEQCALRDAADLYAARRQEDIDVLAGLGVEHVHLAAADALFRAREVGPVMTRLGGFVPELVHRYPTFRFDIAKGRVSRGDRVLLERLDAQVRAVADRTDAALVFGPVGVGRHVDHLITRTLAERQSQPTVLYSDFPYDQRDSPEAAYRTAQRLTRVSWHEGLDAKQLLIEGYRTQVEALFPAGEIPSAPETYFLSPDDADPAARRVAASSSTRASDPRADRPRNGNRPATTTEDELPAPSRRWTGEHVEGEQ